MMYKATFIMLPLFNFKTKIICNEIFTEVTNKLFEGIIKMFMIFMFCTNLLTKFNVSNYSNPLCGYVKFEQAT